jgi:hypothetical protein
MKYRERQIKMKMILKTTIKDEVLNATVKDKVPKTTTENEVLHTMDEVLEKIDEHGNVGVTVTLSLRQRLSNFPGKLVIIFSIGWFLHRRN